jgi:hypothetical protein
MPASLPSGTHRGITKVRETPGCLGGSLGAGNQKKNRCSRDLTRISGAAGNTIDRVAGYAQVPAQHLSTSVVLMSPPVQVWGETQTRPPTSAQVLGTTGMTVGSVVTVTGE